jgi:hypothetical protein
LDARLADRFTEWREVLLVLLFAGIGWLFENEDSDEFVVAPYENNDEDDMVLSFC